eukprot:15054517-Heterocapsa_arctica.AAC.1
MCQFFVRARDVLDVLEPLVYIVHRWLQLFHHVVCDLLHALLCDLALVRALELVREVLLCPIAVVCHTH